MTVKRKTLTTSDSKSKGETKADQFIQSSVMNLLMAQTQSDVITSLSHGTADWLFSYQEPMSLMLSIQMFV